MKPVEKARKRQENLPSSLLKKPLVDSSNLVVEKTHDKKGVPLAIEYQGRLYQLMEDRESRNDFGPLYKRLLKHAEKRVERNGISEGLKTAEKLSKIDILSGKIFLGLSTLIGVAGAAYVSVVGSSMFYISYLKRTQGIQIDSLSELSQHSAFYQRIFDTISVSEFGIIGMVAVLTLATYRAAKQFLDNVQKILLNQLSRAVQQKQPEKSLRFLQLFQEFREYDDAERIEGGATNTLVSRIPVVGIVLSPFLKELVNLQYEKKQLRAVEEMQRHMEE